MIEQENRSETQHRDLLPARHKNEDNGRDRRRDGLIACRWSTGSQPARLPSNEAGDAALEFGRFRVLPRRRQLLADGVSVEVGSRAFDLLLALIEADGSLVTKDELLHRGWPSFVVTEDNLKVQICKLRKALGEDRDVIRTEFGRGYRFTAKIRVTDPPGVGRYPTRRRQRPSNRLFGHAVFRWPSDAIRTPSLKAAIFAAGLGLAMASAAVHAAPANGGDTVQGFYDTLLGTMKNGRTLGESGRLAQLEPVIRRSFDIAAMARLTVGPLWASLSDGQRQAMTDSFGRYIAAVWADRFASYAGQRLEVTREQPAPFGVIVHSRIVKADGEPVEVDYLLRRSGDAWLIADIYLDGTISEVATRRSEFAAILDHDGIEGLVAALNHKTDGLLAAAG
jgi:phospholipid transport system substrate-binding protein